MFNWLIEIISSLDAMLKKASRTSQLTVILITGFLAYSNIKSIIALLTSSNPYFGIMSILLYGVIGVSAGYLAIAGITYLINNSGQRHKDEIATQERALHNIQNDESESNLPPSK